MQGCQAAEAVICGYLVVPTALQIVVTSVLRARNRTKEPNQRTGSEELKQTYILMTEELQQENCSQCTEDREGFSGYLMST